jgi:flagellar biosynthesis protein FlhF
MKIRRYIGKTNQEAIYKLRRELGSDAVILHTRRIRRPGIFGFLKKPLIEVVAAVDENQSKQDSNYRIVKREPQVFDYVKEKNSNIDLNYNKNSEIDVEIRKLRELMENMINKVELDGQKLPIQLATYKEKLVRNGVDENIAFNILNLLNKTVDVKNKSPEKIKKIVNQCINQHLGNPVPIKLNGEQKIIFFIGPTGVGKTTTLAKIAANFVLHNKSDVGLITADTYRIAAVDQLKTYSEILNIPIEIIYETEEIYSALSKLESKELILIDTAGRSHKDTKQMEELKELISSVNYKEIFLVLSASTDWNTLKSILQQYRFIEDYKIIFTKLDECHSYGNILNTTYLTKKSISYFTNGQNVPDDIKIPNIIDVTKELIGEF